MRKPQIFLDDGGVLNDNRRRGEQWQQLVGEYLAPVLGGSPAAWAEANKVVINTILAHDAWQARLRASTDYASFDYAYQVDWLHAMCALVGVSAPEPEQSVALALQVSAAIILRVRAAYPGAVDAITHLHARGYVLNTASGASSRDLEGYLEGMGVRPYFARLYGPDLIDTFKDGPEYYTRLLADAGVAPKSALVVDDNPRVLGWATQAGAQTVLIRAGGVATQATPCLGSLAELPEFLEQRN